MTYLEKYEQWLTFDEETREELLKVTDEKEKEAIQAQIKDVKEQYKANEDEIADLQEEWREIQAEQVQLQAELGDEFERYRDIFKSQHLSLAYT